jgi:hypothetical protein
MAARKARGPRQAAAGREPHRNDHADGQIGSIANPKTVSGQAASDRVFFAPLPPRAIRDGRLSGRHFRVLAAIALHDRMAGRRKRGAGCWASHRTLCDEVGYALDIIAGEDAAS